MDYIEVFFWGGIGALIGEAFGWIEALRINNETILYFKKRSYWLLVAILFAIGGIIATAFYKENQIKGTFIYINIGFAWPLFFKAIARGQKGD